MGEEGFGDELTSMDGYVWLIDPIDGTLNFVKRQEDFGIMIALYKRWRRSIRLHLRCHARSLRIRY